MKGTNDHHIFASKYKIGGPVKCVQNKENICLTTDHARHIYKKLELEGIVNVDTIKQEIEDNELSKMI